MRTEKRIEPFKLGKVSSIWLYEDILNSYDLLRSKLDLLKQVAQLFQDRFDGK